MTAENLQRLKYIIGDIIAASAGWLTYSMIRYHLTKDSAMMAYYDSPYAFLTTPNVVLGQIFFPLVFIFIAYLSGYYNIAYVKSRIQEFSATTFSTFIASMTMFFVILINDSFPERMKNYELIAAMWGCLFFFIYTIRFLLTSKAKARIESGKLYFNTLIIGNNETTDNFLSNLNTKHKELGYKPIGIVRMPGESQKVNHSIPLYEESEIGTICSNNDIKTIIIINEKNDKGHIYNLINDLFKYNIPIKITPELHDILTARIRHSNITMPTRPIATPTSILPQTMLKHIPTPSAKAPTTPIITVRTVFPFMRIGCLCSIFLHIIILLLKLMFICPVVISITKSNILSCYSLTQIHKIS